MQPIQTTIHKRLNHHQLTPQAQAATVVHFTNVYLAKKKFNPAEVKASMLKQKVLWVEVAHPILGQQVMQASMELLSNLQSRYPDIKVSQIRTKALTPA